VAKERTRTVDNQSVTSFRFRLERVRAVRERKEQLAQEQLARSLSRLSDSQAGVRDADADLQRALDEQRRIAGAGGPVCGDELLARQAFVERVEQQRQRSELELERSEADVADRNAELVRAASEHEMLIRLRERRRGEHEREQARQESNANDEIAAIRFGRSVA
jgi:flagellar export protein FliJ